MVPHLLFYIVVIIAASPWYCSQFICKVEFFSQNTKRGCRSLRHPADFSIVLLEKNYHLHITVWLAIVVIGILTKKIFNVSYAKSRNGGIQTRKSNGVSHGKFKTCGKQTQELLIVS